MWMYYMWLWIAINASAIFISFSSSLEIEKYTKCSDKFEIMRQLHFGQIYIWSLNCEKKKCVSFVFLNSIFWINYNQYLHTILTIDILKSLWWWWRVWMLATRMAMVVNDIAGGPSTIYFIRSEIIELIASNLLQHFPFFIFHKKIYIFFLLRYFIEFFQCLCCLCVYFYIPWWVHSNWGCAYTCHRSI